MISAKEAEVDARTDPLRLDVVHDNICPVSENGTCFATGIIGPLME